MRRWTSGEATLTLPACAGPVMLEVVLGGAVEYVLDAKRAA
jgi:hypothetical protein